MNAGQLAAMIAAVSFAVLVCAAVFVLLRLSRLISAGTRFVAGYCDRSGELLDRAQAAIDRSSEQLARTDSITASMDEVTANMAELSEHVSAMAGLARGISAGFGTPLMRCAAAVYGVRRAVARRRPQRSGSIAGRPGRPAAAAAARPAVTAGASPRETAAGRPGRRAALAGSARRSRGLR
ncbi:MAG: DUF948 domain-containing protein [Streptosporangiaceae bacterium]